MSGRRPTRGELAKLDARHDRMWRDPAEIVSPQPNPVEDPRLLQYRATGRWWEALAQARVTLLVSREYEHLLMAIGLREDKPSISYMPMPHPSGIAVDLKRGVIHVACTRNPNQILDLKPARGEDDSTPLLPMGTQYLPGRLYLHDLAMVGGRLHGTAAGENCVVRFDAAGGYERVWWPRCIEDDGAPVFERNHIQLNSIAARGTLRSSVYSASSSEVSARRPGHKNYPVDGRGVLISGKTREPVVTGLTRPHSARFHKNDLWVNNSGYGEFSVARGGEAEPVARLRGWTRGLCFSGDVAFVGLSRVIPRFRQYAPGLDVDASRCGIVAVDIRTGSVLGSLTWPYGNQIFGIEPVPSGFCSGLLFPARGRRDPKSLARLFSAYTTPDMKDS